MFNGNVENVIKSSVLYTYAFSQPFTNYIAAYPIQQDQILLEVEPIELGESGEVVRLVQLKLNHLGYYDDLIDGEFGLLTEYALREFQSTHKISVSGTTDKQTMKMLIETEKDEYLEQIVDVIPKISVGDHNDNVRKVQEVLFYLGYYDGNIDGIYGPLTNNAINRLYDEGELKQDQEQIDATHLNDVEVTAPIEQPINDSSAIQTNEHEAVQLEVKQNNSNIIAEAQSHLGTPYVWGGQSPGGFDCSGFINFVYGEQNITVPRTVNEIWNFSNPVGSPSIGDLVFFETYKAGPSHMGIYLGNGEFIHAGSSRGVEVAKLDNSYWKQRYIGTKRINH